MNPQQISSLIAIAVAALLGPGSYLVAQGFLTPDQATKLEPDIVSAVVILGGAAVAWWQHRHTSTPNLVRTINSDAAPGIKVVRDDVAAPAMNVTSTGAVTPAPPKGS